MRLFLSTLFTFALLCGASPALPVGSSDMDGDDFAWFYNKPSVTAAQFSEDVAYCGRVANIGLSAHTVARDRYRQSTPNDNIVTDYGLEPIARALLRPGQSNALIDNCMVFLRYRRFDIRPGNQERFVETFAALSDDQALAYIASAVPPQGSLAREWESMVAPSNTVTLAEPTAIGPEPTLPLPPSQLNIRRQITSAAELDPAKALLVISFSPAAEGRRIRQHVLGFVRFDQHTGNVPIARPGTNEAEYLMIDFTRASDRADPSAYRVYQIQPGFYALSNWGIYCLSTIWFEVRPGDVVHAGDWMTQPNGRFFYGIEGHFPGMTGFEMAPARAALNAISPALGEELRRVEYHNGARLPCISIAPSGAFELPTSY